MSRHLTQLLVIAVALSASLGAANAQRAAQSSPQAQWTKDSEGQVYAGLPFVLAVTVSGFDDSPPPKQPAVTIPGVTVTAIGVKPKVTQYLTRDQYGRQRMGREMRYALRYRISADRAGTYRVPPVTVVQGKKRATAAQGTFRVVELPTATNMHIRLTLPKRAVWVGETFPLYIDWYLRQNRMPRHVFHIPMFDQQDSFDVSTTATKDQDTVAFKVGSNQLQLPVKVTRETFKGIAYKRYRFKALVTPTKSGAFKLPPARVVGDLGSVFRSRLSKAQDTARTLDVRALPTSGKPASFSNAVGSDFSITVGTKRSFVRIGDPIELDITIRGNGQMEGLILPRLDAQGALPKKQFSVPAGNVIGEVIDKGAAKKFSVVVRLKSAVSGIPDLPFSYFDPKAGIYKTVRSQKIALQVKGSTMVGSGDVVNTSGGSGKKGKKGGDPTFIVKNSRLALSNPSKTLRKATSVASLRPFLFALYGLPLLFLLFRIYQVRTRDKRGEGSAARQKRQALDAALSNAANQPAETSIAEVESALRALAKTVGVSLREADDVLERLQGAGFDPKSKSKPVDAELIAEIRTLGHGWTKQSKRTTRASTGAVAAMFFVAATLGHVTSAGADQAGIDAARKTYNDAMGQTDRDARRRGFARAERMYRELVAQHPKRPELLTDWGNAALGAHELGVATLAYRRALREAPNLARARSNLAWIRDRAKSKPKKSKSAVDTLFFWHSSLSVPQRHLAAAIAFALAMLLLSPWGWRTVLLRRLSVLPVLVCLAMIVSVVLEPDRSDEAVVVTDEVVVRSADSSGAPAVAAPLTAGAEATVVEERGPWTKIKLADGVVGWVQTASVELIAE